MLYIKIKANSLLYGECRFWLVYSQIAPFHLLPDFRRCKSRYVIGSIPYSAQVVKWVSKLCDSPLSRSILIQIFVAMQAVYLTSYLVFNVAQQSDILADLGIQHSDSLTYKILYNLPTVSRVGLLIVTLLNLRDLNYNIWTIYDNFGTLAVDLPYQGRVARLCLLYIMPDVALNLLETRFFANLALESPFYKLHFGHYDHFLWHTFVLLARLSLMVLSLINIMIRYKPMINIIYTATCISKHLGHLEAQLMAGYKSSQARGKQPALAIINHHHRKRAPETARSHALEPANRRGIGKIQYYSHMEAWQQQLSSNLSNGSDQGRGRATATENRRSANLSAAPSSSSISVPSSVEGSVSPAEFKLTLDQLVYKVDGVQETCDRAYVISNLFELERHFTKLNIFMKDIDRLSPGSIIIQVVINFMAYFYLIFNLCFNYKLANFAHSLCLCCARSLAPVVMFLVGNWIEKDCRRLVGLLEFIYLQDQSQSLIYKQLASSHLSLSRVLLLLESMRLDCRGLMMINLKTLRKCFIYIATVIFIVIQYDALMFVRL